MQNISILSSCFWKVDINMTSLLFKINWKYITILKNISSITFSKRNPCLFSQAKTIHSAFCTMVRVNWMRSQKFSNMPSKAKVTGSIPGQGTCLGLRVRSPEGAHERGNESFYLSHIDVSLLSFSLPSPLSKINKIFQKIFST